MSNTHFRKSYQFCFVKIWERRWSLHLRKTENISFKTLPKQYQNTIKYLTKYGNAETGNEPCIESQRLWGPQPQRGLYIVPLLSRLGHLCGKGAVAKVRGMLSEPMVVAGTVSSGHKMFELTEIMTAHAGQARLQANSNPVWRRGSGHKVLPLTTKPSTTDASWGRENLSPMQCHAPAQVPASEYLANTKWTLCFCCYFVFAF